ncbi:MAG: tetratricopeptide repeat protein [Candidatus Obscuribacterales bacterium]
MILRTALINAILLATISTRCSATPLGDTAGSRASSRYQSPSYAALTTEKQIAFFNSKNFQQAAQAGYEILRRDPTNALARYYYAQTLYRLNRSDDAKSQFAECYKITSDIKMKANCYEALKALATTSSSSFSTSFTPAERATGAPENGSGVSQLSGNGSSVTSSQAEVPTSDPALISRKLQIMTEGSANIEHKRQQMLIDVERAKERAVEYMNGIERFYRRPIMSNYQIIRWEQYENPQYPIELERSQRELKIKIEDLNAEFNRREAEILADCKARAAVYDQVSAGLKSQQKIGTSQIQLTPQHSNGFVRHYVNYDGNDPVSLKARQGELTNTKSVTKAASRTNKP